MPICAPGCTTNGRPGPGPAWIAWCLARLRCSTVDAGVTEAATSLDLERQDTWFHESEIQPWAAFSSTVLTKFLKRLFRYERTHHSQLQCCKPTSYSSSETLSRRATRSQDKPPGPSCFCVFTSPGTLLRKCTAVFIGLSSGAFLQKSCRCYLKHGAFSSKSM